MLEGEAEKSLSVSRTSCKLVHVTTDLVTWVSVSSVCSQLWVRTYCKVCVPDEHWISNNSCPDYSTKLAQNETDASWKDGKLNGWQNKVKPWSKSCRSESYPFLSSCGKATGIFLLSRFVYHEVIVAKRVMVALQNFWNASEQHC